MSDSQNDDPEMCVQGEEGMWKCAISRPVPPLAVPKTKSSAKIGVGSWISSIEMRRRVVISKDLRRYYMVEREEGKGEGGKEGTLS